MTELFKLNGHFETKPPCGSDEESRLWSELHSRIPISLKHIDEYVLSADSAQPINFGGVTNAHIVMVRLEYGSGTLSVTSGNGTPQLIPIDDILILISKTAPVTVLSVTRTAGISTKLNVFLAQAA